MLLKSSIRKYEEQLDKFKDTCQLIRIVTKNFKPKLENSNDDLFENNNIRSLINYNKIDLFKDIIIKSNIATYLIFIAEFEKIFYELSIKKIGLINTNLSENSGGFLELFIKSKNDFYPFSKIKEFFKKEDNMYLSEIIALRNFFSHGQKDDNDLFFNQKKDKADINLINDLNDLNIRLKELLKKLSLK